jgi:membrane-associated phospholipid phosphatase
LRLRQLWTFVTDLGDTGVTLPLAGLVLLFLLFAREWQVARAWIVMAVGCAVVIGGLKLLFGACGESLPLVGIASPSGHTAISVTIYLSFALLLSGGGSRRAAWIISLSGVLLVASISVSQIVLQMHDLTEVLVGIAVGIAAYAGLSWMTAWKRTVTVPPSRWQLAPSF